MKSFVLLFFTFYSITLLSQIEFADIMIDSYYSGVNPDFNNFYGNNGLTDGCNLFLVPFSVVLGDNDSIMALPTDSYITLGFTDNLIFDAPGQDDLFIEENGGGQEFGELYVSPDGVNFTYLDIINGAQINSFDLSDYPYDDVVKAVKIVGKDNGGCVPGMDIERVYGLPGANCPCGADLADFPEGICASADTLIMLDGLVIDTSQGVWIGPSIVGNEFNPINVEEGVEELEFIYLVNIGHPICPVDSILYRVDLATCDCNDTPNGPSVIDDCGLCLSLSDPLFNETCRDCDGVLNGPSEVDSCGLCLVPSDESFNSSCLDCNDVIHGTAVLDLCGQCLQMDDPMFNQNCPERFKVFTPNVFNLNASAPNNTFGLLSDKDNLGFIEEFNIYDKWGTLVFSIHNQKINEVTRWWDGTMNSKEMTSGVYTYLYVISYPEIGLDTDVGTVLLLR